MTEHNLTGLHCGATGQPAVTSPADQLAQLRHQQKNTGWHEATPLVLDAAQAYKEVMGDRQQREAQLEQARRQPQRNTFL